MIAINIRNYYTNELVFNFLTVMVLLVKSNSYVSHLGDVRGQDYSPSRLRRSVSMATYDPLTHATLIDSIGNAHSERSLERLSDHVTRSHDLNDGSHDLTIRHAAVNAIREFDSEDVRN